MRSTMGRPRQATDEQIKLILTWHAGYLAWLAKRPAIPTQDALAKHLKLSPTGVNRIIRRNGQSKQMSPENHMTEQERGRPRHATDEQIQLVLAWQAAYLAWQAQRPEIPTQAALAKHLKLHPTVVNRIIHHNGEFKQVSPEKHTAEQEKRRAKMREIT